MAEKTDLNISPYYDDYSEDKKFHKVLYRAGRPLQARELTQSQSILQNQIERMGDHFFEEGTIIQGAQTNIDMDVYFVKVKAANPNPLGDTAVESYRTSFHDKYVRGQTTGVVAKVITSTAETSADKLSLFVRPVQQGTNSTNDFMFSAGETLELVGYDSSGTVTADSSSNNDFEIQPSSETPTGRASLTEITEGVVFTRGFFTKVDKQTLILEKYNGAPSYRIGLDIVESLVTSAADDSLEDNAAGTSNENAAGADRLKFSLTLAKHKLDSVLGTSFVELSRVNAGVITLKIDKTKYAEIENTLARRTFDANGDFVVTQFTASLRQHLDDGTNLGFYTKNNGGDEGRFVFMVSPGKAYVKGFEIDKVGTTTLNIQKARTTESLNGVSAPIRLGNKLRVYNAHGLPEFGNETGSDTIDPHNPSLLYDKLVTDLGISDTDGALSATGNIGTCRIRNVDLHEGIDSSDVYTDTALWNLYLFDIKMFTKLTGTIANTFVAGDKVTGSSTGTTAIVHHVEGSNLFVHDVQGAFTTSDNISAEGSGNTATLTSCSAIRTYNIDRARAIAQKPNNTNREIFTADVSLTLDNTLTGTLIFPGSGDLKKVTGFATQFVKELKEGDQILDLGGTVNTVASVESETALTLTANNTGAGSFKATRRRAKLFDQNQTANIHAFPRDFVESHTPQSVTVRRQVVKEVSSNQISITTGAHETFNARNTDNFAISVREAGSGYGAGALINVEDLNPSVGVSGNAEVLTLTLTGNNGAFVDVTYTVTKTSSVVSRGKSLSKARVLKVSKPRSDNGFYGTAYDDKDITLGVADVHKVIGVFEGIDGTPITPNAIITTSDTFVNHEIIIGQTSGARASLINFGGGNLSYWYYTSTDGEVFLPSETVVGQTSLASGTMPTAESGGVNAGSPDIKDRYFFDNGQRDGYYDLSKLTLKPGQPKPSNPLLLVFDSFTVSGGGDFFDVNSYSSIDYKDIPVYSPNKVDLGGLEPDGTFELSDCVDFRPVVGQILGTVTFSSTVSQNVASPVDLSNTTSGAVFAPFGYESGRSFLSARGSQITATGANSVDVPVSGSSLKGDIKFFVGRIDKVFLHKKGKFEISQGTPALSPTKPTALDDSIQLFEMRIPPYTNRLSDIQIRSFDHRRYTMKDIGKINNRVTNLERITSLSLLEKDTQTKQILDAEGFDRFKSGFLVDNFRGHKIGDVNHPDYNCAIDTKMGMLRPKSFTQFFGITQNVGGSSNFTKTGDIITLPYSEVSYVNQDKASRSINVNPYHVFAFIGVVKLTPDTDIWQDTDRLPDVRVNREGNFDAVMAENANSLGTVWNSWQTTWVGEPTGVSTEVQSTSNGSWSGDPLQGGEWVAGITVSREITETPEIQTRTGVTTSVVEDFVETRNDRIVSMSLIPFIRSRTIEIDATNLKPNSNHYFYFDNINVNKFVRPFSATYSQDSGTTVTSECKTDGNGRLRAFFELPNSAAQRFPTGQRDLRITSSFYNMANPASQGNGMYSAQGILQATQTEIVSTRNGRVIREDHSSTRDFSRRGERLNSEVHETGPVFPPVNEIPVDNSIQIIDIPDIAIPEIPIEIPNIIPDIRFIPPVVALPTPPILPIAVPQIDRRDFVQRTVDRPLIFALNGGETRGWGDPLAQSFLVDAQGGMDMTSIDLFFATKDTFMPCSVQIRNMVNGYPGQIVLPFSDVTKNPEDINISADGSVKTTFTFESMVHLEQDMEYCFVVYSNSNEYECFISRMGETDITTAEVISGQPYAGSLFMSQNASTWTAEQTDDLKFNMKVAKYEINKVGNVNFENDALPYTNLQTNPIETFADKKLKVYSYNHGFYDDTNNKDNVTLAGVVGDKKNSAVIVSSFSQSGSDALPADGTIDCTADTHTVSSGNGSGIKCEVIIASGAITDVNILKVGQNYTTGDVITITNIGSSNADVTVVLGTPEDTLGGCPIDVINRLHSELADRGIDSFRFTPTLSGYSFSSAYAFETTIGGGANATATRNYYFDAIHTMIPSVQLQGTIISANVLTTPQYSPEGIISGTAYQRRLTNKFVTLNDNVFFDSPSIIASSDNESREMSSQKSFNLQLQLMSFNPNISPMIDVQAAGCLAIANRINNIDSATGKKNNGSTNSLPAGSTFVPSTESEGDNNVMVYVTRKVNLKTPATSLKVIADMYRPPTTELKLMFKIIKNDEETLLDDVGFEYFNTDGSPDVTTEADARNFKEYEFTADNLPEFSGFVVKIVGQGTSTSIVPAVTALRCMALA
jgi:preprotein translocase subunit YajC